MSRFIVLEGPDGSGTTKHSQLLAQRLQSEGRNVLLTAEPSDGSIGQHIRIQLSRHEDPIDSTALQLMFCADRADHLARVISPALEADTTVICDRYTLSTICYGAALGLDAAWLERVNSAFRFPDITMCLLPPFSVCQERLSRRNNHDVLETTSLQERVYQHYYNMATSQNLPIIDTNGDLDTVAKKLYEHVEPVL